MNVKIEMFFGKIVQLSQEGLGGIENWIKQVRKTPGIYKRILINIINIIN